MIGLTVILQKHAYTKTWSGMHGAMEWSDFLELHFRRESRRFWMERTSYCENEKILE